MMVGWVREHDLENETQEDVKGGVVGALDTLRRVVETVSVDSPASLEISSRV